MSKLLHTLTYDSQVGIWEDQTTTARIYADKIIVESPYVKWIGNTGNLAFRKVAVRNQTAVDFVLAKMAGDDEDAAWAQIQYIIDYHQ